MSEVVELTKEEFSAWLHNPVTVVVFNELQRKKEEFIIELAQVTMGSVSSEEIAFRAKECVAKISILEEVLQVDWKDDIITEEDSEVSDGN